MAQKKLYLEVFQRGGKTYKRFSEDSEGLGQEAAGLLSLYEITLDVQKMAGKEEPTREEERGIRESFTACFGTMSGKPTQFSQLLQELAGL